MPGEPRRKTGPGSASSRDGCRRRGSTWISRSVRRSGSKSSSELLQPRPRTLHPPEGQRGNPHLPFGRVLFSPAGVIPLTHLLAGDAAQQPLENEAEGVADLGAACHPVLPQQRLHTLEELGVDERRGPPLGEPRSLTGLAPLR